MPAVWLGEEFAQTEEDAVARDASVGVGWVFVSLEWYVLPIPSFPMGEADVY